MSAGGGGGLARLDPGRVGHRHDVVQHVLGQRDDHRARPALHRDAEGAGYDLGDACGVVDLDHPLSEVAEGLAVVDLLEGLAPAHAAGDLPDEQDHGRRVLPGDVHARRGVGGAGPAGDEADARPPGELAGGLRHDRGPALLAADEDVDGRVVQGV